jgi:hypothetical protein
MTVSEPRGVSMRAFIRNCRQFKSMQGEQKKGFLAAVFMLPCFWIGLRVLGFARMQTLVIKKPQVRGEGAIDLERAKRLGDAVNKAARHSLMPVTCLTRSMVLNWLLRRQGTGSELRIGVQLEAGAFAAHAWVECHGTPVNDRVDIAQDYFPFDEKLTPEMLSATSFSD